MSATPTHNSYYSLPKDDDTMLESIIWGFVLVRCTYTDDERWNSFLSAMWQQNIISDRLFQPWTIIEDKDKLHNATLSDASIAFQSWVATSGVHENLPTWAPRLTYFIYVNEESIESVISSTHSEAWELTGNFLVLVDASRHIESCNQTEDSYFRNDDNSEQDIRDIMANADDAAWKLIPATNLKSTYVLFLVDSDPWHQGFNEFQSAPYVYHRLEVVMVLDSLIEGMDPGYDIYKMLKRMYGENHPRSICFETDEAQTRLQRMCGYAGGWRGEEYTDPCYL